MPPTNTSTATSTAARPSSAGWTAWWPVVMMLACSLLSYIDRQTLAQLSPMILGDLKLSAQKYGEIISAFSWAYALANPLWGSILDRIGLRRGMMLAVTIWTIACGAHAVLSGFWGFAVARAILGFGEGATFPGGLRTSMDWLPSKKQSRGLAVAYGGGPIGAIITPLIVTPIALRYGWRAAFIVTGAAGFVWVLGWRTTVDFSAAAAGRQALRFEFPNPLERRFWSLVSAYALGALPLALILYLAQIYLSRALSFSQADLGRTLWIPALGWAVGYFVWGWFNDRFTAGNRRPSWLFGALAVMSLPLADVTSFRNSAVVLGLMFWAMFVASGFVVAALRMSALAYPREQTGLVAGIGAGSWSALVGIVMPIFGRMFDAQHYTAAFALAAIVPVFGAMLWWLFTLPERELMEIDVTK